MAFFPCPIGPHRYRGPASHFYPARVNGLDTRRAHLRVCPAHADELILRLEPYLVTEEDLQLEDGLNEPHCGSCKGLMSEPEDRVFVTAYPRSADRADYWFNIHTLCRLPIGLDVLTV